MRKRGTNYKHLRERARRLVANDDQLLAALAAMGEIRRYAHAVGVIIEHRVVDDDTESAADYSEPVAVTHECGQIEFSHVIHNPSYGPISQISVMGQSAQKTLQVETTPA